MTMPRPVAACLALIGRDWQTDIILTGVAVDRHPGGIVGHLAEIFGGESPTIEFEIRLDGVEKGPAWLERAPSVAVQLDNMTSCQHSLELGTRYRLGANESLLGFSVPFGSVEVLPHLPGKQEAEDGKLLDGGRIALLLLLAVVLVGGGRQLARWRR